MSMPQSPNDAARDLWSQIFERAAAHPGASIMAADYDPAEDLAEARSAWRSVGWSEDAIDTMLASNTKRQKQTPATSPGVNPSAEAFHADRCNDIEDEMARQGLTSQRYVARGIEPRTGPFASKVGVIMTEQSIITAGTFTYRFCGVIAKAFNRTLQLNPQFWDGRNFRETRARHLLRIHLSVAKYWNSIFMSFAFSGTHATVPFDPSLPNQLVNVEQVARAMELFIIGHEYGHHHFGHGRDINADSHAEEFEADQFALRIGTPIGVRERRPFWNPYLASGAGGIIVLKALEILRLYEVALGSKLPTNSTHPSVDERLARFETVAVLQPEMFEVLKGFRRASQRIMDAIAGLMTDFISVMPDEARLGLAELRQKLWHELPKQ